MKDTQKYIADILDMTDNIRSEFLKDNEGNLLWETHKYSTGGQSVGKVDPTIYLTHLSTGIKVVSNEARSHYTNRNMCILKLILEIYKKENE